MDALGQDGNDDDRNARVLKLTVREAHVVNIDAPVVHLRLSGAVYDHNSGRVVKRFKINERVPATENHMPQIVDAYEQAAANAAQRITKGMKQRCK